METIVSRDGTRIAYRRSGAGPPLVLVHGGTADHSRWAPVLPLLEPHSTVYAIDRRGRGGSSDTEPYAIEREFEDVAAVVDSIGDAVDLLGHSFGAVCALEATLRTPRVRRLILYEPPSPGVTGTLPADVAVRMERLLETGDRDGVVSTFLRDVAGVPPHELEMLRSVPAWAGRVAAAHTILREIRGLEGLPMFSAARLQAVKVPVLLLQGGDSPRAYGEAIETLHAALSGSRIVVLSGQQHVAMNTAPDLFAREVTAFLTQTIP